MDYETLVSGLKFDDKGLIPVVVQDYVTHEVLTLAYMNRESLKITLEEKRTCFYSRSRQCLWRKGETSGNVQTPTATAMRWWRRSRRPVLPATRAARAAFSTACMKARTFAPSPSPL